MRTAAVFFIAVMLLAGSSAFAESRFLDADGVKIHYTVQGEGEPVLLIHGFSASIAMQWQMPGIIRELEKTHRVIALDNRGHGKSDKPHDREKYGLEIVHDPVRVLDELGIDKAHVIGYSLGAFITLRMLTVHPDRMLSATLGGAGWSGEDAERLQSMRELAESLDEGRGFAPLLNALTPEGRPALTEEQIANMNRMMMAINDTKALAALVFSMDRLLVTRDQILAIEGVPMQALIGSLDPLKDGVNALAEARPDVKVTVIDGTDHMSAYSSPLFLGGLQNFLAAHAAPAPADVKEASLLIAE